MSERKGNISVQTADIFPIIKKWLYSEHDIFLRELVANSTDAITKRAALARTKNEETPAGKISIVTHKSKNTVVITDNGIGMTETEVEKYIAQLAFSGAQDFVKKIEADKGEADIIGKFGLGFFSCFMVASKVEIETLSMEEGATPVKWSCSGDPEYTFEDSTRTEVGTSVILHLNEESKEFIDAYKISPILRNYCDFMPYPIEVLDFEKWEENQTKLKEQEGKKDLKDEDKVYPYDAQLINDSEPLWKKDPSTLEDQDYIDFFSKLYPGEPAPLFWIHLKVDHPFILEGILYFPKINKSRLPNESNIRLYCKQVFVSNNVKNIIPEFLTLIKGTIDSSDIPLNVSRSALQGDPNVKKISNYVIKKVAESLKKLFKNDREKYQQIWDDIGLFIKYGVISAPKFDEPMRKMVVFKNSEDKLVTIDEWRESIPEKYKEKVGDTVLYFEENKSDTSIRKHLLDEGIQAILVDDHVDPHFMQHVEMHKQGEQAIKFSSIDAAIETILDTESTNPDDIKIKELFDKVLVPESKDEKAQKDFEISISKMKNASTPAYLKTDEQMKRMQNMFRSMGQDNPMPLKKTLVVNPSNPLIQNALRMSQTPEKEQLAEKICIYVKDLANISSEGLNNQDKEKFIFNSQELIKELTDLAL